MTFGSLFSGIGGLDLGLERAGMTCKWQVEIDDYATKVLEKHWPKVRRWPDVRTFPPNNVDWPKDQCFVDLICGGFPCQDISIASSTRTGLSGERSGLWKEFARVLRKIRPQYALIENSPELSALGLDRVLCDLAEIGMDATWTTIRASQLGAKHRRERMFICAYTHSDRLERWLLKGFDKNKPVQALDSMVDWPIISTPIGCRSADGIPSRVDRTRCLGNAVVPQVAEWIGRQIMEAAKSK